MQKQKNIRKKELLYSQGPKIILNKPCRRSCPQSGTLTGASLSKGKDQYYDNTLEVFKIVLLVSQFSLEFSSSSKPTVDKRVRKCGGTHLYKMRTQVAYRNQLGSFALPECDVTTIVYPYKKIQVEVSQILRRKMLHNIQPSCRRSWWQTAEY